jgi:hypothetical protein
MTNHMILVEVHSKTTRSESYRQSVNIENTTIPVIRFLETCQAGARLQVVMSFGPPPSQLCLLSALPSRSVGDKVRFLGW